MLIAFSFFSIFFKSLIIPVVCPAHFHLDLILAKDLISLLPNPCSQRNCTESQFIFPEGVLYNPYSSHLFKSCEQEYNTPYKKLSFPFGKKKKSYCPHQYMSEQEHKATSPNLKPEGLCQAICTNISTKQPSNPTPYIYIQPPTCSVSYFKLSLLKYFLHIPSNFFTASTLCTAASS